jgi:histidinol-phosphate aminotransferase
MIKPNAHIASMAPYGLTDLTVPAGKPLISLAQNESALPPSPHALAAGRAALSSARLYSDPNWTDLRRAIAAVHGLAPERILCGAGSMELIACLLRCYAGPGRRVLSSQYGYAFFRTATLAAGAEFVAAPEHDFTVSVDGLLAAVDRTTRIVCLANPGNPTGTRIARSELVRLRDRLDDHILLLIDEAYGEFTDGPDQSTFDLVSRGNAVVLRTFSKAYGLAGLRVGWGVFPGPVAGELRKLLNPNNVSAVSQAAATAAMNDQDHRSAVCAETAGRRDRFVARVRQLGLRVPQSHTNFALLRFADAAAAARADRMLRAEGILLRAMAGYGLADCLRATIADEADMDLAATVLAAWHAQEGSEC